MDTIEGISIEELKKDGLSNRDIEFIRETGIMYRNKISEPGMVTTHHSPASVIKMLHHAFEAGITIGIARARKLTKVSRKIGF